MAFPVRWHGRESVPPAPWSAALHTTAVLYHVLLQRMCSLPPRLREGGCLRGAGEALQLTVTGGQAQTPTVTSPCSSTGRPAGLGQRTRGKLPHPAPGNPLRPHRLPAFPHFPARLRTEENAVKYSGNRLARQRAGAPERHLLAGPQPHRTVSRGQNQPLHQAPARMNAWSGHCPSQERNKTSLAGKPLCVERG